MVGFAVLVVLQQVILVANPASYHEALQEAELQQRPLLVLVGADWCPGCQTMKHTVLPGLIRRGALRTVSFVMVDADAEAGLARQLMRGSSIPQLIIFSRKPDGDWHRDQITGQTSEADVQSLIARAVKVQQAPAATLAGSAIGN
jgi:thioredoxin-like negative regulator of GroEL